MGTACEVPPAPGGHVCKVTNSTYEIDCDELPVTARLIAFGGEAPQVELGHAGNVLAAVTPEDAARLARGILGLAATAAAPSAGQRREAVLAMLPACSWPQAHPWWYRRQKTELAIRDAWHALIRVAAAWLAPGWLCRRAFTDGFTLAVQAWADPGWVPAERPGRHWLITQYMRDYDDGHDTAVALLQGRKDGAR